MRRLMNVTPNRGGRWLLALLPFALIAMLYAMASAQRLAVNAEDKVLPSLSSMVQTLHRTALEEDRRTGERIFWADTKVSLKRLGQGLAISIAIALVLGLAIGLLPMMSATFSPLMAVISMVPPMAILPILFIAFGLDELSKVMLIIIGVAPCLIRDLALKVSQLPKEQLVKAQTLGASTWQVMLRVALPQAMPRLIESTRLMLGPAFLFLISAEAISADAGLGYRIFLVRRYLSMDLILPYVAWITLLAYVADTLLVQCSRRLFPWAHEVRA
ncbi:NitT/TauT family transport system permease protein [Solimonas aquatica]|uniref:NitT/TauT family transport system permease protein n=1 Tax=Solimonas aquatica TaxID=489703 RepID=A0A1H9GTU4_9GAMM|nr:ABC transporter permease [Solimonas aquatica]SEQ53484.1 NitT/TauT family transport system permease protein [Solimonas aquatica]